MALSTSYVVTLFGVELRNTIKQMDLEISWSKVLRITTTLCPGGTVVNVIACKFRSYVPYARRCSPSEWNGQLHRLSFAFKGAERNRVPHQGGSLMPPLNQDGLWKTPS
ncbi:unnamed protein product [Hymenolepis diminuta]|uniref:Uncharacterized protein n=1 Tax=Hymenolepis diminuta TaxID=6216 RepID=A0A564Z7N9_HYMDI|nr:unnamed protein product [Hymenolepis diminuta]